MFSDDDLASFKISTSFADTAMRFVISNARNFILTFNFILAMTCTFLEFNL